MEHQTGWQGRVKIEVTRHSVRGSGQDDRERKDIQEVQEPRMNCRRPSQAILG